MTEQDTGEPLPAYDTFPRVIPEDGSRLASLCERFDRLKADAEEAASRFEACKAAIKVELAGMHPGSLRVVLTSPALTRAQEMVYVSQMRLDTKKLKAVDPGTYCLYARPSGSWQLRGVK